MRTFVFRPNQPPAPAPQPEEEEEEDQKQRGGTVTDGKRSLQVEPDRLEKLKVIVEEASVDVSMDKNALKTMQQVLSLETLAKNSDHKDASVDGYVNDELEAKVKSLMSNKNAFAQQLVALYGAGFKAGQQQQPLVVVAPPPVFKKPKNVSIYGKFVHDLNDIVQRGLQPLLLFTGMVNVKLGEFDVRPLMLYRKDNASDEDRLKVFDEDVGTRQEFLATIRDAGPTLTTMFLTTLEKEAEAIVQETDRQPKQGYLMLGACFDLDELDKDFAAVPHPAFNRTQLDQGIEQDQVAIQSMQEQLRTLKESIRLERAVEPTAELRRVLDDIAAKRAQLRDARNEREDDDLIRDLQGELQELLVHRAQLEREPQRRVFDLQERARVLQDAILRRQQTMQSRNVLHETREAIREIGMSEVERRFAPAWAFEVMGSAIFRRVLSTTTLAAFEVALAHVNQVPGCSSFTMKELICSKAVAGNFAFLVASNFLSSGDGATRSSTRSYGGGGRRNNNNYLNVTRVRDIIASKVETCKVWFESVVRKPNSLCAEFAAKMDRLYRQKLAAAGGDEALVAQIYQWKERMIAYKQMLPQYELVYVG